MQPPARGHESIAAIVLLETHRYVDRAADDAIERLVRMPPSRSPRETSPVSSSSSLPPNVQIGITMAVNEYRAGTTLSYPPTDEARLTDEELRALAALDLQPAARSALRKVVRAAASTPLFHLFCLLDAVGDPALTNEGHWSQVYLSQPKEGALGREMMHDAFFDSFHDYAKVRAKETNE